MQSLRNLTGIEQTQTSIEKIEVFELLAKVSSNPNSSSIKQIIDNISLSEGTNQTGILIIISNTTL